MSTTIKRVALVAVAALGLGVVSVAPSSAMTFSDSLVLSSATASQLTSETATAGSATATLTFLSSDAADSMSVVATLVSAPAGNTVLPYILLAETSSATAKKADGTALSTLDATGVAAGNAVYVSPKVGTTLPANISAKFKVFMNAPAKVGTYVVKLTPAVSAGGGSLAGTAQTLTITVTQNPADDTVAASATSYLNAGETISATADVTVTSTKAASTSDAAATIKVTLKNANADVVSAESYTATIAGPGVLGSGAYGSGTTTHSIAPTGRAITVKAGDVVAVFPDGTSGVSTITIGSAAGVILATEKVTFFGDAATVSAVVKKTVIGTSSNTAVLEVTVKDAAGVSVSNLDGKLGVVSSDIAKIATSYASTGTYDVTTGTYAVAVSGVAAGSANLVVTTKASSTATTGVDAAAVSVRVGSYKPASVKVTTDKSAYAPGEKGSISVQLLDADGLEVVSGETYTAIFTSAGIASSYALQNSTLPAADVISYTSGGRLYTFYAPVTEGDVKFSWTTGATASYGVKGAAGGLATANQSVAGSVTIAVSSAATSAAIDAAQEAAAAAQDATDAAISATEAAEEASALAQEAVTAVATLSAQVSKLITALKAQITTLSNLVAKIAKKVKA